MTYISSKYLFFISSKMRLALHLHTEVNSILLLHSDDLVGFFFSYLHFKIVDYLK